MRLTLHPGDGAPRAFWVTRRQWLGLIHALAALPHEPGGAIDAPPQIKKRLPAAADISLPVPLPVQGIRLRRLAQGVKIVFVAGDQGAAISLEGQGLHQLRQMLRQQAERAEWDAGAALARLNAQGMARAAMRKASRTD